MQKYTDNSSFNSISERDG